MAKFLVKMYGDRCKGCELCCTVCPKHVLALGEHINPKGYHPAAVIETDEKGFAVGCVGCSSCALMCPDGAIEIFAEEE